MYDIFFKCIFIEFKSGTLYLCTMCVVHNHLTQRASKIKTQKINMKEDCSLVAHHI